MCQADQVIDLEIDISQYQVCIYGRSPWADVSPDDIDNSPVRRALRDAQTSGLQVGTAGGVIGLRSPVKSHNRAAMRIEVWPGEPFGIEDFDHVVDVDLDLPTGELNFEPSEVDLVTAHATVPAGRYRARIAGGGFATATADGAVEGGADSYRIQLWPRTGDSAPALVKRWAGWPD